MNRFGTLTLAAMLSFGSANAQERYIETKKPGTHIGPRVVFNEVNPRHGLVYFDVVGPNGCSDFIRVPWNNLTPDSIRQAARDEEERLKKIPPRLAKFLRCPNKTK